MGDSLEVYNELRLMRARLDGIEAMQEIQIRADRERIEEPIWRQLSSDPVLAEIYLLVDGKRTQKQIAELLVSTGTMTTEMTVSRKMRVLLGELHLIEFADHGGRGKFYRKTRLDRILGISRRLHQRKANAKQSGNYSNDF
jgi:hypothetical protein